MMLELLFDHLKTTSIIKCLLSIYEQQDSPPAWTQEAYWPRCIKYSICCPVPGGGGTPPRVPPILTWLGGTPSWGVPYLRYPHPDPWSELPHPCWGYPTLGTPLSDLARVPPIRPGQGTSLLDLVGVSPQLDLAGVPPHQTWSGYPPSGPGRGTPPPRCGQTDRHVSKHNLPVVLRTRSVKTFPFFNSNKFTCIGCQKSWKSQRWFLVAR